MPVITSLMDTSCASLGTAGLLAQLNATLGTSYTMDAALSSLLEAFISSNVDFGTAYGLVRPLWYDGWMTIQDELRAHELKDREKKKMSLENIMPITGAQCIDNVFAVLMHMQKRVSENPVDKVMGLACLLEPDRLPAYYEMQSLEDAWMALVNVMRGEYRGQMLLWYPESGKGRRKWRPSWEQIMTEFLPMHESPLREDAHRDEETDNDWYKGVNIEKGYVRGLAMGNMEREVWRGELVVQDSTGMARMFEIVATHQYPIPEDFYTLISGRWDLGYWAIGRRMPDQRFEKVSTFRMSRQTKGIQRLARLGVGKWSRNCLS
ncbi:hypothetical protein EV421DRAFT_1965903 [Armillaria borealis]|uniref:Uncharacterized protein n=1 Tax=Armillaria borealis TaxID=47425 RepID=A0AA39IEN8_9AGAR|nr:hypothetical protein EV421DRAFT_1965903 [Armillaria borealis]